MQPAVAELPELIRRRYPATHSGVIAAEDPEGIDLAVLVAPDDLTTELDAIRDRPVERHVDQSVLLYRVPVRLLGRVLAAPHLRPARSRTPPPRLEDPLLRWSGSAGT
jgi:hypothetical protein